jgi:hypothetical protein
MKQTYIRFWCKKCNDFTLHNENNKRDCAMCGEITHDYLLSSIPDDKAMEQQKRFISGLSVKSTKILNHIAKNRALANLLYSVTETETFTIIEDDAGCKEFILSNKLGKTGRNDSCPCGSNNKYKRCCLERNNRLENIIFSNKVVAR